MHIIAIVLCILLLFIISYPYIVTHYRFHEFKNTNQHLSQLSENELLFATNIYTKEPIYLLSNELNVHMFINGTTGSGKTTAFINIVCHACKYNHPLIYLDGKGSTDLIDKIAHFTKKYNRNFKIFTFDAQEQKFLAKYDFLGSGNFTNKKNRLMKLLFQAQNAATAYYQDRLERFINAIFQLMDIHKIHVDLKKIHTLINCKTDLIELAKLSNNLELIEYMQYIVSLKNDSPLERINDILSVFINSHYGKLFDLKNTNVSAIINLKEAILNKEIILFLLDSSAYSLDTAKVAKMIISDINSTFAQFSTSKQFHKTFCIFDEFASYATNELSTTISLHRSNGIHACVGTQSIATIALANQESQKVAEEILSCCNTFLALATNNDKDIKRLDNIFKFSNHSKNDKFYSESIGDLKLNTGIGYLYRKSIGASPVKIQINKL